MVKKGALLLIAIIALVCAFRLREMLLIECCLVLIAAITAFVFPDVASRWFAAVERRLARVASRRAMAVMLVGLAALVLRAAILPIRPTPVPGVHDEFGYLLMADTFSHGRLTNPTHPMWVHFETFSVIQKPTYQCFAPPAQGFVLAFGRLISGRPFVGVWLSAGLMCAGICWMLQGWFPPFWALLGGLLAVIRLASFSYWVNSYFGGAAAAFGGALVLGALPRIKRYARPRDALIMGLGIAILAISRPYESVFFCLPIAVALFAWLLSRKAPWKLTLRQVVLPISVLLVLAFGGIGYYCYRVTGSPLRSPYAVHQAAYMPMSYFPWRPLGRIPEYHHEVLRRFYLGYSLGLYELNRHHPIFAAVIKLAMIWFFYFSPIFTLPILMLGVVLPRRYSFENISRNVRFLLLVTATTLFGMLLPIFFSAHYAAPLVCVFYALLLASMQRIRHWRLHGKATGLAIVRAVPVVAMVLVPLAAFGTALRISNNPEPWTWCSPWITLSERARIESQMEHTPGRHLLIVHYEPNHNYMAGWVYNRADIDSSKIVWANDMGAEKNQELIQYFKGRQVWLVEPDLVPARISPYR